MESRKSPGLAAGRTFGLFNSLTSQNSSSITLKPAIEINDVDSILTTIITTENSEIIAGFETGTLCVFDDETGELKRKLAQTDFTHGDDEPYTREYYYEHQLRHVIPFQQNTYLTANNQEIRMQDSETGEKLKSFASFPSERICSLLDASSPLPNQRIYGRNIVVRFPESAGGEPRLLSPGQSVTIHTSRPGDIPVLNRLFPLDPPVR